MFATDDELRAAVDAELTWDPSVDSARVSVAVRNAVVTLRGTVGSYPQKRAAHAAAGRILGVVRVDDALEVELPAASRRTDLELRTTVAAGLATNVELRSSTVRVRAEDGWITLTGTVTWHFQRIAADRVASSTIGVYGVTTDIELLPEQPPPPGLKTTILQAVSRSIPLSRMDISVGVSTEGVVTLRGVTPSALERDSVVDAAWCAPGVVEVVTDIQLERAAGPPRAAQLAGRHG